MAVGRPATKTRRIRPQVTIAGPDSHKIPRTGGTFFRACRRSRHALVEDCGLASVIKLKNYLMLPIGCISCLSCWLNSTCDRVGTVLEIEYSSLLLGAGLNFMKSG